MRQSMKGLVLAATLLAMPVAFAQGYTPDIAEFDGSNALAFDADPQLGLADGGTIEFWVMPDWDEDPGYDPAIIANGGPDGLSYLVAMLRDRDGIAFAAGSDEDVATFDFTDGQMHHVAISQLEDGIVIVIDGQVAGTSDVMALDLPSTGVWVGSIDGENNQFRGAIAGLRIWSSVIGQEDLVDFAFRDIFADDHPALASLVAMSDFSSDALLLVEANEEATDE